MPTTLEGSCRCGAVSFTVQSHTPYPYMRSYCSICRKIGGGGGYAINIMGLNASLDVKGCDACTDISVEKGGVLSQMSRTFCSKCSTALWGWHPAYAELVHPFASAIDTQLPVPPTRTHIMLEFKAPWVQPDLRDGDQVFNSYPDQSIEDWHKSRNLWIE